VEEKRMEKNEKEENNSVGIAVVLVVLILVVVGVFYYTSQRDSSETAKNTNQNQTKQTSITTQDEAQTEETDTQFDMVVEGFEFGYTPDEMVLAADEPVRIRFVNTGTVIHDFVIDEFDVRTKRLAPGEEEIIEFTPRAGTYNYYCSVGNHRQLGMEGTLTVE
jgi:plastocyanin